SLFLTRNDKMPGIAVAFPREKRAVALNDKRRALLHGVLVIRNRVSDARWAATKNAAHCCTAFSSSETARAMRGGVNATVYPAQRGRESPLIMP
ncbi:MAG TPA: hypothetical protein PLF40_33310, partial [Kofleriaceae bacterium]|nr:hypothetical protein [Kofleriaceae bacterium]